MSILTREEMLKVVVGRMVEGGWKGQDKPNSHYVYFDNPDEPKYCYRMPANYAEYSINDLIADAGAMKAAYGDGCDCGECRTAHCPHDGREEENAAICKVGPRIYAFHQQMAIILSQEDAVQYLFDNLPKGEGA